MTATEAYKNSLRKSDIFKLVMNDIKNASDKGYTCISCQIGLDDSVIKELLDLGYRYFEHDSVMGDVEAIITWDPNFQKGILDYEVKYDDLEKSDN